MTDAPNIFVAGLGRCGTTLVMTMLDRGGFPVVGSRPAYELDEMRPGQHQEATLRQMRGRAVKWIDPTAFPVPIGTRALTVWMHRDPIQQARSQMKLLGLEANRQDARRMAARLRADELRARETVRRLGPVLDIAFESILQDPTGTAIRLSVFLEGHGKLETAPAASVVIPRSPLCAPDLSIEFHLMREAGHV
ncbi:sulfotransferase [Ancylobacter mangrovi]|uniref:sulfotransferase n=1 Tax=Ancylobacter mangrovi TaxID=2972472 RepID=UPI0021626284|nr:sulfotransferase [Ancylobacter mangrovi]MCS0501575.1 sulfotransferase [Ancylobacter mangrovi]